MRWGPLDQARWHQEGTSAAINAASCFHLREPQAKDTMTRPISRRHFLVEGGKWTALASGAVLAQAMGLPHQAEAIDWSSLVGSKPSGGTATVKFIQGVSFAESRRLRVGDTVHSGDQLRVAKGGRLIFRLEDNSVMCLVGEAVLNIDFSPQRVGIFKLLAGAFISVLPRNGRTLVQGPTATIGIKGTVFYHELYLPDSEVSMSMEGPVPIPAGISEYFCLCNGEAEYLRKGETSPYFTDMAHHHNSFYVDPKSTMLLNKAKMLNHTDAQIDELIGFQDEPRHDGSWLEL